LGGRHAKYLGILVLIITVANVPRAAEKLAPPLVYSSAQAQAGGIAYSRYCASCHGASLEGGAGPALKGTMFTQLAAAQSLTAQALLNVIVQTMPQSEPGSLAPEQYAAVVAYLLQENGYPAGKRDLVSDDPNLKLFKLGQ
jgi:polar amino acid transport system substrate-binding protein